MKAVVIHAPKDLRIDDVGEDPLGPKKVRIKIGAGGICGSDLHYYHHGGFGDVRLQEPMILGHEIAGTVAQCGTEVGGLALDDLVTINPSRPCGVCAFARVDCRTIAWTCGFTAVRCALRMSRAAFASSWSAIKRRR